MAHIFPLFCHFVTAIVGAGSHFFGLVDWHQLFSADLWRAMHMHSTRISIRSHYMHRRGCEYRWPSSILGDRFVSGLGTGTSMGWLLHRWLCFFGIILMSVHIIDVTHNVSHPFRLISFLSPNHIALVVLSWCMWSSSGFIVWHDMYAGTAIMSFPVAPHSFGTFKTLGPHWKSTLCETNSPGPGLWCVSVPERHFRASALWPRGSCYLPSRNHLFLFECEYFFSFRFGFFLALFSES